MKAIIGYIDRINYEAYCDHRQFFGSLTQNVNMNLTNYFPIPIVIDFDDWMIDFTSYEDRVIFKTRPKL